MNLTTLKKYQQKLIEDEFLNRSQSTKETYNIIIEKFLQWMETTNQTEITTENNKEIIGHYQEHIKYKRNKNNRKQLSAYTQKQYVKKIQYFLRYCGIETKEVNFEKNVYTPSERKFITKEDYDTILKHTHNQRDRIIIQLLFTTGIRVNELVNIRIEEYINGNTINGNKIIHITGKGNKGRSIAIPPSVVHEIETYIKNDRFTDNQYKYLIAPYRNNGNKPVTTNNIRYRLKQICEEVDSQENTNYSSFVTPHIFRHGYAVYLLEQRLPLNILQELLGHSNIRITNIYTKVGSDKAVNNLIQSGIFN